MWSKTNLASFYSPFEKGFLGKYEEIFTKFLPKSGKILEAGCGRGQLILALRKRGYEVEGIEFGKQTIELATKHYPSLPIRFGDVANLNIADNYYDAYISIGVVEHNFDGPDIFLQEARRILKPSGIALISVPHLNLLRRLKMSLGLFNGNYEDLDFYQYAFSNSEFREILHRNGFDVLEWFQLSGYKGIKDEIRLLHHIFNMPFIGWRIRKFFQNFKWAEKHMGHMMLFVCRII